MTGIALRGAPSFVGGDWGTSRLRLFLCDAQGTALDTNTGPGAVDASGHFADIFDSLTARWEQPHGSLPAVLCGMVGSSIGWIQAPYVPCPAIPEQIADACVTLHGGCVHVVPGLSCRNRFDAPDFLRGEETQILGALLLAPTLRVGRWLLCLPGTHTKWAMLEDGAIREFLTAPTGELFAVLCDHSVLVSKHGRVETRIEAEAFKEGLAQFNAFPHAQLLHRLFECRSRQLRGEFATPAAAAYLSGLLVASDVHGALSVLSNSLETRSVYLIGSSELMQLYSTALASHGYDATVVEGAAAARAGLVQVHRRLSQRVTVHDI
jgi:2-dehydro-3-deoxygalactonokinase